MSGSLPVVTPSPCISATVRPATLDMKSCVGQAFTSVLQGGSLRGKWLTASCLVKLIKQRFDFRDAADFNAVMLNQATFQVNRSIGTDDRTNTTGQFRLMKWVEVGGKYSKVAFYYITDEGNPYIGGIPGNTDTVAWKEFYDRAQAAVEVRLTRLRAWAKKARLWDHIDNALLEFHSLTASLQRRLNEVIPAYTIPTYWESTEAKIPFGSKPDETFT
jgi:hypothetical protein